MLMINYKFYFDIQNYVYLTFMIYLIAIEPRNRPNEVHEFFRRFTCKNLVFSRKDCKWKAVILFRQLF